MYKSAVFLPKKITVTFFILLSLTGLVGEGLFASLLHAGENDFSIEDLVVPQLKVVASKSLGKRTFRTPGLRTTHELLLNCRSGEQVKLSLSLRKVDEVQFEVTSPTGKFFESNASPKVPVSFTAPETGTYLLVIRPAGGRFILKSDRPLAVRGHCRLLWDSGDFYFPASAMKDKFKISVLGGGGKEMASVRIRTNGGKELFFGETTFDKSKVDVELPVGTPEKDEVWCVRIDKASTGMFDDAFVYFTGQYASVSPAYVMIEAPQLLDKYHREAVADLTRTFSSIQSVTPEAEVGKDWRNTLLQECGQAKIAVESANSFADLKLAVARCAALRSGAEALQKSLFTDSRLAVVQVEAISNKRVLPHDGFPAGTVSNNISATGAGDQYVPISFVIHARDNVDVRDIVISDLKSDSGTIAANKISCRLVKAWFQEDGGTSRFTGEIRLLPELLLYDSSLVKVNYDKKENFIKATCNGKESYISGSLPEGIKGATRKEFSIRDADSLQPFSIPQGANQQVFILVRIPENTEKGNYRGTVTIDVSDGKKSELALELKVLPFNLPPSGKVHSIYYYGPKKQYYGKNRLEQFCKESRNLREHGITNIMFPFNIEKEPEFALPEILEGEANRDIFYRGKLLCRGDMQDEDNLKKISETVKKTVAFFKERGINNVYFYGIDEAKKDEVTKQRKAWEAIKNAGGKVFVSGYREDSTNLGNFKLAGDIQDLLVCAGPPYRKEAKLWHKKGHRIFCYGNPQGGQEVPQTYRYNYGLLLWQNDYDGGMTYIYHWGGGQGFVKLDFASVWNDVCRAGRDNYKQHNMVYPTTDGVIDTLQWEGYREANTDLRYIAFLEKLIRENPESDESKKASAFLEKLREFKPNLNGPDLLNIRQQIISLIMSLQDNVKDEAVNE